MILITSTSDSRHQRLVVPESVERDPGHRPCLLSLPKLVNLSEERHDWATEHLLSTALFGENKSYGKTLPSEVVSC